MQGPEEGLGDGRLFLPTGLLAFLFSVTGTLFLGQDPVILHSAKISA